MTSSQSSQVVGRPTPAPSPRRQRLFFVTVSPEAFSNASRADIHTDGSGPTSAATGLLHLSKRRSFLIAQNQNYVDDHVVTRMHLIN